MLNDRDALLIIAGNIEQFYLSLVPEHERSLIVDVAKDEAKHLREIAARTPSAQGPDASAS